MRSDSIYELLDDVKSKLDEIEILYQTSKTNEAIDKINNPLVKSTLENLRSVLDYSANDIYEYVYCNSLAKRKRIYFPYADTKGRFKEIIAKSFPGLKIKNEKIYNCVLSIQSFTQNEPFLYELCNLTNYFKHNNIKKQKRINEGNITTDLKFKDMSGGFIRLEGNSQVSLSNCTFSNGDKIATVNKLELSNSKSANEINEELKNELIVEREYERVKFDIDGLDIYALIRNSYHHIKNYVNELYRIINDN